MAQIKNFKNHKINIFLDLDGPVLDNSRRLYNLYTDLLSRFGKQPLPMRKYWSLKRNHISEERITVQSLLINDNAIKKYLQERERRIEWKHYLKMNKIVDGCFTTLQFLSLHGKLFLTTTRKIRKNLIWELNQKKLIHFFSGVLCEFDKTIPIWEVKSRLIEKSGLKAGSRGIIIGDTEAEIICGKKLELFTIAVTNGLRSKKYLISLKPDMICKDIGDVVHKWQYITKNIRM